MKRRSEPARQERREKWRALGERMLAECRAGGARNVAYWAQQLAWSPVVPHALSLKLRESGLAEEDRAGALEALDLAVGGLGALPEAGPGQGEALFRVAARQARALSAGRRSVLLRLRRRISPEAEPPTTAEVPSRMMRIYDLVGWNPPEEAAD